MKRIKFDGMIDTHIWSWRVWSFLGLLSHLLRRTGHAHRGNSVLVSRRLLSSQPIGTANHSGMLQACPSYPRTSEGGQL